MNSAAKLMNSDLLKDNEMAVSDIRKTVERQKSKQTLTKLIKRLDHKKNTRREKQNKTEEKGTN